MGENILEPETVAGARARVLGTTWTDLVLEILGRILNSCSVWTHYTSLYHYRPVISLYDSMSGSGVCHFGLVLMFTKWKLGTSFIGVDVKHICMGKSILKPETTAAKLVLGQESLEQHGLDGSLTLRTQHRIWFGRTSLDGDSQGKTNSSVCIKAECHHGLMLLAVTLSRMRVHHRLSLMVGSLSRKSVHFPLIPQHIGFIAPFRVVWI